MGPRGGGASHCARAPRLGRALGSLVPRRAPGSLRLDPADDDPRPIGAVGTISTPFAGLHLAAFIVIIIGAVLLWRRDLTMAHVLDVLFAVPVAAATCAGLFAPVLLDPSSIVWAWGALVPTMAWSVSIIPAAPKLGMVLVVLVVAIGVPKAVELVNARKPAGFADPVGRVTSRKCALHAPRDHHRHLGVGRVPP